MRYGFAALALACAAAPAFAADTSSPPALSGASLNAATDAPSWLVNVAGVKLIAVDGSTLALAPTEGGLSVALISQNGAAQKSSFAFLSDRLGTISDDADAGHVTGFFRETDNGFEAQFADGRTESLVANIAGGMTMTVRNGSDSACTSWYPPDHTFSATERKAALAAYADRLGLGEKAKKAPHIAPVCAPAIKVVRNKILPKNVESLVVVTHPGTVSTPKKTETSTPAPNSSGLIPIAVRSSQVHLIDGPAPVAAPLLIKASASAAMEPALAKTPALVVSAPAGNPSTQIASVQNVPAGNGASDCLSVESDGASLGFRNHCAYGVQFAYCLQRAGDTTANCDAGSKTGSVSATGFAAVLLDTNIKTADAEHDFRWVACSGDTGNVIAHLDRSDPPVGRCVVNGAM
jgi:hypothetical protein